MHFFKSLDSVTERIPRLQCWRRRRCIILLSACPIWHLESLLGDHYRLPRIASGRAPHNLFCHKPSSSECQALSRVVIVRTSSGRYQFRSSLNAQPTLRPRKSLERSVMAVVATGVQPWRLCTGLTVSMSLAQRSLTLWLGAKSRMATLCIEGFSRSLTSWTFTRRRLKPSANPQAANCDWICGGRHSVNGQQRGSVCAHDCVSMTPPSIQIS